MNGLLIIDKPDGMTSHDVVARVRRLLGTKRVGHTGTLDPFATGVMVLLVGTATRLAQFIDKDEKEYDALVQFGFETDTGDVTGTQKAAGSRQANEVSAILSDIQWQEVFAKFRGEAMQKPPMYSAKKVKGKKLYELARKGVEIERKAVPILIHSLDLVTGEIRDPQSAIRIHVACSAGTYIRTLAEDIGREIGVGAHLVELRRTRAGRFALRDAVTLKQLENMDDRGNSLIPITEAVVHLPGVTLSAERAEKTRSGLASRVDLEGLADGDVVRMLNGDSNLIAIGEYDAKEKSVKPKIVLI
jgi:tRNA pseudouridine55 synthase